ncbi:MAG: RNA 3'-terminal phosphate cyclase [Cyanobacteria bacterium P01_F01_bin.150]
MSKSGQGSIFIDGADGGGQILRSSLSLSIITGQPFHIRNIRGQRSNPGLRRQHLNCVTSAAMICGADVQGAELGSQELVFYPNELKPGTHTIDIGTAGSSILVAQTLFPALWNAETSSEILIIGGTHNRNAPTADYCQAVYLPAVRRLGIDADLTLVRHGFEPKGGGKITIRTSGQWTPQSHNFLERGTCRRQQIQVKLCHLDEEIAHREINAAAEVLGWNTKGTILNVNDGRGRGNAIALSVDFDNIQEQTLGIGVKGISAEKVARTAATEMVQYLNSGAVVGKRLADQLQIPLALIGKGSMLMPPVSNHFRTNARVIESFTGKTFRLEEKSNSSVLVTVV